MPDVAVTAVVPSNATLEEPVIARVTLCVPVVTMAPAAFRTTTWTGGVITAPAFEAPGCTRNASCVAGGGTGSFALLQPIAHMDETHSNVLRSRDSSICEFAA